MKTLSIFLSLINTLLAGVILLASLTGNELTDAAMLWALVKSLAMLGVIFTGGVTWFNIITNLRPGLLAVSSIALIMLGTATFVWTFHLTAVNHTVEYAMAFYGVSLIVQGLASLLGFVGDLHPNPAT